MTLATFGALAAVWAAAIALPGPDIFQIIRIASKNTRAGVYCALGIMAGNTLWIVSSLAGLATVFAAIPALMLIIQILGGLYLARIGVLSLFSGIRAWKQRHNHNLADPTANAEATSTRMNAHTACVTGVLTNLSNPKAVVFFASVFAHFIEPGLSLGWALGMALFLIITGIIWFAGLALFVRTIAATVLRNTALIDIIAGSILLILSSMMLVEGIYAAYRAIPLN